MRRLVDGDLAVVEAAGVMQVDDERATRVVQSLVGDGLVVLHAGRLALPDRTTG